MHAGQQSATSVSAIQALLRRQQVGQQVRIELEDRVVYRTAKEPHEYGSLGECQWQGIAFEAAANGLKVVGFQALSAMDLGLLQGDVLRNLATCPQASSELEMVKVIRDQTELWIAIQPLSENYQR